jgi:hypothetical protein
MTRKVSAFADFLRRYQRRTFGAMNPTRRPTRAAIVALTVAATVAAPTASAGDIVIRRDGSKAVYVPPAPPPLASPDTGDGFHLGDAGIGAAGMLALVLAAGGAVALHGRRPGWAATHSAR